MCEKQAEYEVTCILKDEDDDQNITQVGGLDWQMTAADAILEINFGTARFFTQVDGVKTEIHVVSQEVGLSYLRTSKDMTEENNLLSLPPCEKQV